MARVIILQNYIPHYRKPFYRALSEHHRVTVVHSGAPVCDEGAGFSEHIVPKLHLGPFFWQRELCELMSPTYCDVVVAMCDVRWLSTVFWAFWNKRTPMILWGHRYSRSRIINLLRNALLRRASAIIQYSACEYARMKAFGIVMDKVFCAPNTIEVSNSFDCSEHPKKSFLFVGRAQARKRVDLLLQSFSETRAMLPSGASVDIVGVGAENVRLREIAVQLGIEKHVRFHGEIHDSNRLRDLFKEAFAYVSPGPVGLGVLHSFAYGVPVVTKRQGKHGPEFGRLKDGVNSVIFDGDEDLSQTLIDLATVPGLSQRLGHAAFCDFLNEGQLSTMVDGFNAAIQRSIEVKVL